MSLIIVRATKQMRKCALLTHGMLVTILARASGVSTAAESGEQWYTKGQKWADENGISSGDAADIITISQFASILYAYSGQSGSDAEALDWAASEGYIDASESAAEVSRAAAATILHAYLIAQ
jgi:hypothetical protein